jgi:hypothetical protein
VTDIVSTEDLAGAIHTLDRLIDTLRELQAHGVAHSVEEMALADLHDDDDPLRTGRSAVAAARRGAATARGPLSANPSVVRDDTSGAEILSGDPAVFPQGHRPDEGGGGLPDPPGGHPLNSYFFSRAKGGHLLPHLRRPPRSEESSVRRKFLGLRLRFRARCDVIHSEVC